MVYGGKGVFEVDERDEERSPGGKAMLDGARKDEWVVVSAVPGAEPILCCGKDVVCRGPLSKARVDDVVQEFEKAAF